MKNRRGQALIEFILILPVLILILLAIVDFGNIISNKYTLESDLDTVVNLYQSNKKGEIDSYVSSHNETIDYEKSDKYLKIKLKKGVRVNTPILNNVLGKNYKVEVSRSIVSEDKDETE